MTGDRKTFSDFGKNAEVEGVLENTNVENWRKGLFGLYF